MPPSEPTTPPIEPTQQTGLSPAELDAEGRERPRFLLAFPKDPALAPLVAAFERGDFRYVRKNAPELVRTTEDDEVRRAALELRSRIDPDPLVIKLLLSAVGLFLFLTLWAYLGH